MQKDRQTVTEFESSEKMQTTEKRQKRKKEKKKKHTAFLISATKQTENEKPRETNPEQISDILFLLKRSFPETSLSHLPNRAQNFTNSKAPNPKIRNNYNND